MAYSVIIGILTYFFDELVGIDTYNFMTYILLFYYTFLTGFVFYVILLVNRDGSKSFISYFIGSIVVKLIFTIILSGVVIYLYPDTVEVNVILILIYYVLYTALELYFVKKFIDDQTPETTEG